MKFKARAISADIITIPFSSGSLFHAHVKKDITPGRQRRKQENFYPPRILPEIKFIIFYRHLVTIKYCNKKCQGSRAHTVRQRYMAAQAARVAYVPTHFDLHFAPIWTNL
jgi:hypothetical protein